MKDQFYPFLKKEKIKLNCGHCTSAVVWVVFKKENGKTSNTIVTNKKCGSEFKGKQLEELKKLLDQISLPELFDGKHVKVHLGSALKC
ncbi:MAG: hypothetical protein K0S12_76 [Bacteroidetes bacterium]|nr:hypothetical protein [Bacteroidota bacterium]